MRRIDFDKVVLQRIALENDKQRYELVFEFYDPQSTQVLYDIHKTFSVSRSDEFTQATYSKQYAIIPAIQYCIDNDIVIIAADETEIDKAELLNEINNAQKTKLESRAIPEHHCLLSDFEPANFDADNIADSLNSLKLYKNKKDGQLYLIKSFNKYPDSRVIDIESFMAEMHRFALGFDKAVEAIPIYDDHHNRQGLAVKYLPNLLNVKQDFYKSQDQNYYQRLFQHEIVRFYVAAFFFENVDMHFENLFVSKGSLIVFDFERALWWLTCKYYGLEQSATDESFKTPPAATFLYNSEAIKSRFLTLPEPYFWANAIHPVSSNGITHFSNTVTKPIDMENLPGYSDQKYFQFLKNILMPYQHIETIIDKFIGNDEFKNNLKHHFHDRMKIQRLTLLSIDEFRDFILSKYEPIEKILDQFDLYFRNSAKCVRLDEGQRELMINQIRDDFIHLQEQARLHNYDTDAPNKFTITRDLQIDIINKNANVNAMPKIVEFAIKTALFLKLDLTQDTKQILLAHNKLDEYEQQRNNDNYKSERLVRGVKTFLSTHRWEVKQQRNPQTLFHNTIPSIAKEQWEIATAACEQADVNRLSPNWPVVKKNIFTNLAKAHSSVTVFRSANTNDVYGKFKSDADAEKLIFKK